MIGIFILLLVLTAVPAMIFLNQHAASHGAQSLKRLKGRAIAEEGTAFAIQQIQNSVPANTFPAAFNPGALGFDGSKIFASSQGSGVFQITVPPATGLESYQVKLEARPGTSVGGTFVPTPGSSIATIVSKHTVGIKLPTGLNASAAVQLANVPVVANSADFRVLWGPIALYDKNLWAITKPCSTGINTFDMNCYQMPRKFSIGGLTGAATGTNKGDALNVPPSADLTRCPDTATCVAATDQKEYWAFTSLGFQPVIDDIDYINSAKNTIPPVPAPIACTAPVAPATAGTCIAAPAGSGNFDKVKNSTAVFPTAPVPPNFAPSPAVVIYIDGSAFFGNLSMDFKQTGVKAGALIVTRSLTIANSVYTKNTPQTDIRLPPTYNQDMPYASPGAIAGLAAICPSNKCNSSLILGVPAGGVQFRGFLWVKGDLTIKPDVLFAMSGVLRVDGTLTVEGGTPGNVTRFIVFYDDEISRQIRTSNLELQVDSSSAIP